MIELELAKPLEELTPIECPTRGNINFPCAVCQECEIGEVFMTMGNGYMIENTVNSILIHLELPIQDDPLEKAALQLLKNGLTVKIPAIQKGSWEMGDLQILLTNDMVEDKELVDNVKKFMEDFPRQFRQKVIAAKRSLKTWSDREVTQIAHQYFKEM